MFCRKVNIPYEVYAFSNSCNGRYAYMYSNDNDTDGKNVKYKIGDIHCWPEGIYHATGNAGLWPRYALTITGCVGPDSLHLKKPQQYDL